MESQKPKIAMFVKRPFGEKLNASFDFIKENSKQLFLYSTYLILPLCLLQSINVNGMTEGIMEVSSMQSMMGEGADVIDTYGVKLALHYFGAVFFSLLGTWLLTSLVYALFRLYNEREERLVGISFQDIKLPLLHNAKKLFLMGLFLILLVIIVSVVIVVLATLSFYTLVLTLPLLVAFGLPLALMSPIYLLEDISLVNAFYKSFRLGFATWGGLFLMLLVMGIIAGMLQGIFSLPWYVIYIVKMMFFMSDGSEITSSVGLNFVQYLFSVLMLYGTYLSAILGIVGLVYHYGHASEVVDSITVEGDIENFDQL